MFNGREWLFIGLGRDVEIGRGTPCFGWEHSLALMHCGIGTRRLAPIQIDTPNVILSTIYLIVDVDVEALEQWASDSFDMVVIHVPPSEKASCTYKQLIRVALKGLILLGATRS